MSSATPAMSTAKTSDHRARSDRTRLRTTALRALAVVLALPLVAALVVLAYGAIRTATIVREVEAEFPPIGQFAEVLGEQVHYVDLGPKDAPPQRTIVLLHGASANLRDIVTPFRKLSARYRVIAIDRPGHGWSSRNFGRADAQLKRQAEIVVATLHAVGIERAMMLGHSFGGALAMTLALDQPQHVAALILVSPVTHPWPGGVGRVNDFAVMPVIGPILTHCLIAPVGERILEPALALVFSPATPPVGFAEATGLKLVLRPADFRANAEDLEDLLPQIEAQAPRYTRLKLPVLVLTGDTDQIVKPTLHAEAVAREVPGARLVRIAGAGHVPLQSKAGEALAAIETFVDALPSQ